MFSENKHTSLDELTISLNYDASLIAGGGSKSNVAKDATSCSSSSKLNAMASNPGDGSGGEEDEADFDELAMLCSGQFSRKPTQLDKHQQQQQQPPSTNTANTISAAAAATSSFVYHLTFKRLAIYFFCLKILY